MKKIGKVVLALLLTLTVAYYGLGFLSSYVGWYGYKKWQYRVRTGDINESKKRNVFVRDLNFKVDGYAGNLYGFKPYIEKGFKYGHKSSDLTVPLVNPNYPYQISFSYLPTSNFGVLIRKEELKKFDSSDAVWGYLKLPHLKDTITIDIGGEGIKSATIKVW